MIGWLKATRCLQSEIMNLYLELIENKRKKLLSLTNALTVQQYNTVPKGFNNNIIWNMGHLLAVSERVLYDESGRASQVHKIPLDGFKRGTKPREQIGEYDISYIRDLLLQSLVFLQGNGTEASENELSAFKTNPRAMEFLLFHEDYHYNRIKALMETF